MLLLKSYAIAEDGSAIWELKLSQAAPYKRKTEAPVPGVADDNGYDGPDLLRE